MEIVVNFYAHLELLLGLMLGMTCFKIVNCKPFNEKGEEFSWQKLFSGVLKQLIVITGCLVVFAAGQRCGDELFLVQIGESKLTVHGAIDVAILIVDAFYAAKFINNFLVFCGVKDIEVKPASYDSDGNCVDGCDHGNLIGYCYAPKGTVTVKSKNAACAVDVDTLIDAAGYGDQITSAGSDCDGEEKG